MKISEHYIDSVKKFLINQDDFIIEKIYGGGSQREYFRIKSKDKRFILCRSSKPEETSDHIDITLFLLKNNIPVPVIYDYKREEGLIFFEDAGEVSLMNKVLEKRENTEEILHIYKNILDNLIEIQSLNPYECPAITKRSFDIDYYRWETDYFLESCVNKVFNLSIENKKLLDEFYKLAGELTLEEHFIVMRDFQSQNINIKDKKIFFLDYQGARLGVCQYDVASLLYDPYVNLSEDLQTALIDYYYQKAYLKKIIKKDKKYFLETFYKTSLQRLMQAMGAYGFLGLVKGKKEFLQYTVPALAFLKKITTYIEGFPELRKLLKRLGENYEKF